MELRVLHYFLTVAREGNFSRAAEKLHLSQPTLSRQIKDMEDEYGKVLLIREPRRVLLTEDGELLRRRAEEILSLVEKTEGELLSNDRSISGDIRIGAGESVNFRLVMQVAKEIRNTYPDIRFHIISGDGETTLLYNASLMARESLGCALAFENIINTKGSDICYRPL
ncbi:MAG: LysR family transcriptional regulator, partial [Bacteroidales bacterium]|nr:LysR family transcriptional regulator [Bacteroidales bacterium]